MPQVSTSLEHCFRPAVSGYQSSWETSDILGTVTLSLKKFEESGNLTFVHIMSPLGHVTHSPWKLFAAECVWVVNIQGFNYDLKIQILLLPFPHEKMILVSGS